MKIEVYADGNKLVSTFDASKKLGITNSAVRVSFSRAERAGAFDRCKRGALIGNARWFSDDEIGVMLARTHKMRVAAKKEIKDKEKEVK